MCIRDRFIPFPITVGFTTGIAVTLFTTQLNDFFGLNIQGLSSECLPKWWAYITNISKINWTATAIGVGSIIVIVPVSYTHLDVYKRQS